MRGRGFAVRDFRGNGRGVGVWSGEWWRWVGGWDEMLGEEGRKGTGIIVGIAHGLLAGTAA